jgi:hypothetical protein
MPGTKISALASLSALTDASVLPVVNSATNYKITGSVLATYTTSKIPTASNSVLGLVKVDGTTVTITDGVISASGGGGGGVSISDFGVGFVNTLDSGKITTSKLYNKNPNPGLNNQYELSVTNGGVVALPDGSIINGATLKTVAGNYAGITAGPAGHDEDSWVWVDNNGATIATNYSTNAREWTFNNDGDLTLPAGGTINNTDGIKLVTDRGTLAIGTQMETPGVAGHFHIAFDGSNSQAPDDDLFLGDDYNYVKLPGNVLNPVDYGVEIGTHNREGGSSQNWRFGTDGGLTFPDGSVQTTAYTGQTSGGGSTGLIYIMANIDGNIVTSTDGVTWGDPVPSGMPGISRVAVHNGVIVYIASGDGPPGTGAPGMYYSTVIGTVELCTGTDAFNSDPVVWLQVRYFDEPNKWVAVGFITGGPSTVPIVAHSTNGISWTLVPFDTQFGAGFNTGDDDWQLTDVVYMAETGKFVISSSLGDSEAFGGIFITDDVTVPLTGATHVAIDLDVSRTAPFTVVQYGGPPGYMILVGTNDDVWYGWGTDPEDYSLDTVFFTGSITEQIGYLPTNISEIAYDADGFIAVTGDGQVFTATVNQMGPGVIVSIPLPYTATAFSITNANPAVLTYTPPNGSTLRNNEKIVITGSGEYNGTYYWQQSNGALYTNQALSTALDASGFATFASGGTLTMSHGQYFDAAGTSPAYYYIGNDDEQIFRSSNGVTWTQLADVNGEYFNDFAYGTFGAVESVSLTNDKEVKITVGNTEYFAIVNRANNHDGGVESSAVEYDSEGNLVTLHISEVQNTETNDYTDKLIISKFTSAGSLVWQKQIVQDADDSQGHDIVIDSSNNIFVMFNQDNAVDYQDSLVVIKFNSEGVEQWKKLYHSTVTSDIYNSINPSSNTLASGTYNSNPVKVIELPGDYGNLSSYSGWSLQEAVGASNTWTTIETVTAIGAYNSGNNFTPVYLPDATTVTLSIETKSYRVTRVGVSTFLEAAGSATDNTHTYIAARYYDGNGDYDITWLMKIVNSTGALVWANSIQFFEGLGDEAYGMDIDSQGNIVVVGAAYSPGPTLSYVAKFSGTDGSEIWTRLLVDYNVEGCTSGDVTVDSQNNVFVSFNSTEKIVNEFSNEYYTTIAHVIKLNSAGAVQWTRRIGPGPCASVGTGIDCDIAGNVYLSALTVAQANPTRDTSPDYIDNNTNVLVVAKYSTAGIVLWQRYIEPAGYLFYQSKDSGTDVGDYDYNANSGRNLSVSNDGKLAVQVSVKQKEVDGYTYDEAYWESITFQIDQDGREMTVGSGNEKFTVKASRIPGKLTTVFDLVESEGIPYTGPAVIDLTEDIDVTNSSITYEDALLAQQTATSAPYEYVFGNDGTLTIPNDGDIKLVQTQIGWFSIFGPTTNYTDDITPRANCVDPETGDVYMVGRSDDYSQGFVARYNSQGEILWTIRLGEDSDDYSSRCNAVKINPVTGNIVVLAEMYGSEDNTALIEIDPDTARVVRQAGIRDTNNNNGCLGYDLDFLSDGTVIVVGRKYDEFRTLPVTAATGSGADVLFFLRANIIGSTSQYPDTAWYVSGTGITGRVPVDSVNRYSGLTTTVNQGSGQGCTVTVVPAVNGTVDYLYAIDTAGNDYSNGDVLTIVGTQFPGGTSPANDITMTVVDASVGGVGGVATVSSVTGTAPTTYWRIQTTGQTPDYSTGTYNMLQPLDGEAFVLAGTTNELTGQFTIDWSKTVSGGEEEVTDRYLSVAVSGTDIYAVGEMLSINNSSFAGADLTNYWCAVVSKFNSAGVHQWTKALNDTVANCYAKCVSAQGNSVVVTHQNTNTYHTVITKLDNTGAVKWQRKTYSDDDSSVAIDNNGDIYAVIESNFENQYNDIIKVIKFNSNGEIAWRNFFGTLIRGGDGTNEAFKNGRNLTVDDNHLYVSGYTNGYSARNGFLVKLPKTGDCDGAYGSWVVQQEQYNVDKIWATEATAVTPVVGTGDFETVDMYFFPNWWDPSEDNYYQNLDVMLDRDGGAIEFADGTRQTTSAQMIPQVALTNGADHRLSIEDMGKHIYITNDASRVVVPYHEDIPLPIGFVVTVINNSGDPIDIDSAGNNIDIIGPNQILSGSWALANRGMATLIKVENGLWFITGNVSDDS